MTQAAKAFGKRLDHFWDNAETQQYMRELALQISNTRNSGELSAKGKERLDWQRRALASGVDYVHIYGVDMAAFREVLTVSARGNGGGAWAHPKLAVFFARWLDVRFAVWCDSVIDEILRGGRPDPFKGPTELPTHPRPIRIPVTREEHFHHMEAYRKEMLAVATQRGRCFLPSAPFGLTIRHPMGAIVGAQYRGS